MGLLDGELQADVFDGVDEIMLDVTLVHYTGGTPDPTTNKLTGATATTYTVRGFRDDSSTEFADAGLTREGDMTVMLLADSRAWSPSAVVPAEGDKVTVQGETGTIKGVLVDPAQATYLLDCKR
jgi:hypothetical protein